MCFEDPYGANFYSRVADHFRAFAAKVLEVKIFTNRLYARLIQSNFPKSTERNGKSTALQLHTSTAFLSEIKFNSALLIEAYANSNRVLFP